MNYSHFCFLLTTLVVLGVGLFAYKICKLKLPLLPQSDSEIWILETEIRFQAEGGPAKVVLSLPENQANYQRLGESFISRRYGRKTSEIPTRRRSTWSMSRAAGEQTLYYRAIITPRLGEMPPKEKAPELPKPSFEGLLAAAADSIIEGLREKSADTDSLVSELVKLLNNPAADDNMAVFFNDPSPSLKDRTRVAVRLLRHVGYPARTVNGIKLQESVRDTPILHWLEVWRDGAWQSYSVLTGEPEMPREYFAWWYGPLPMGRVLKGGRSVATTVSVSRDRSRLIQTATGGGRYARHLLTAFSPFSLPLGVQAVYRVMLMVPLGVLIMVFFRNVVGIQTFGTFMPVLIALSLRQTGLLYGIFLLGMLIGAGLFLRLYLSRLKLLMVPRLAAVLTVVVMMMMAVSILAHRLELGRGLSVALFPLVIITMTIERMSIVCEEKGWADAIKQGLGALLIALAAYPVLSSPLTEHLLFVFPELLLLVLAGTLLIGRYTGYRLLELFRFKPLIEGVSHD
jgi:hypothetical protein